MDRDRRGLHGDESPDLCPNGIQPVSCEIFVEVPHHGRERDGLDSDLVRPVHQAIACAVTCRIVVADDIEPAQLRREQDGGEVSGRECGNHRHSGQSLTQRQDGFDTFPRCHDILRITETNRMSEQVAHCLPRRIYRCLAGTVRGQPCAVRAGDPAIEVGDGGDHGGPGLRRAIVLGPPVAVGVEAQICGLA